MPAANSPYSKPGPLGGRLIREVISFMRKQGVSLPIPSHILIATSGGIDSMAMAHLLTHYGRKIVEKENVILLHINHGWRGEESDLDARFVKDAGKRWGVPVIVRKLKPPVHGSGQSWEEQARTGRKKIFDQLALKYRATLFTAHQADDLAETLLWRLFTGAAQTHGGGVAFSFGVEMRPFLSLRKSVLKQYLVEVHESFREDATNLSDRFLRAKMRKKLMQEIERLFPKAIDHLGSLALEAQKRDSSSHGLHEEESQLHSQLHSQDAIETLIRAAGIKARRPHLTAIMEKLVAKKLWYGEIHLPGGWKLIREKRKAKLISSSVKRVQLNKESALDRWILERF